jgi:HTH-type transcriptional regulator/antitoxin HigA
MAYAEEARKVSRVLAEEGIRFVIVEHLPGTRIDGATLWLSEDSPVIALSVRYDRIDSFWFTLCHELAHVLHEHAQAVLDLDLLEAHSVETTQREAMEAQANRAATEMLIPRADLDSFIVRMKPYYSKDRIIQFAQCVRVHPGIVVGQLQYRGEVKYYANREMLVAIRDIVVQEALTDGWGRLVSIG